MPVKWGFFYRLNSMSNVDSIVIETSITCGVISPKTTINNVEQTTAIKPDVSPSSKMVNVEFTKTLPSKILHNKKLPWSRTG